MGRVRDKDHRSEPDRRSEAINFGACQIQIANLNLTPSLVIKPNSQYRRSEPYLVWLPNTVLL